MWKLWQDQHTEIGQEVTIQVDLRAGKPHQLKGYGGMGQSLESWKKACFQEGRDGAQAGEEGRRGSRAGREGEGQIADFLGF